MTDADRLDAETWKLIAEQRKLDAEARKYGRETWFMPIIVMISGMTAGAALLGAGILLAQFLK